MMGAIGAAAIIGAAVSVIGMTRGHRLNRPAALTSAALFLIAAAIAFK